LKIRKKVNKKKKLFRPTVPNFFGDVSGNKEHFYALLTYRQPAQNGALTDLLCGAIFCIQLSILPKQKATIIINIV